jgi:hypothetical protein
MICHVSRALLLFLPLILVVTGCQKPEAKVANHQMGEPVEIGKLTYVVVESTWRTQLGEGFQVRSPQNRFLVMTLSITNHGSADASIPLFSVESSAGQKFQELSEGVLVTDWLGIIRRVAPDQTIQGRVVFDVPLSPLRLGLPDASESGYDKYAWVEIPMRIDTDQVQAPPPGNLPGNDTK